jgi:hypothetical protein
MKDKLRKFASLFPPSRILSAELHVTCNRLYEALSLPLTTAKAKYGKAAGEEANQADSLATPERCRAAGLEETGRLTARAVEPTARHARASFGAAIGGSRSDAESLALGKPSSSDIFDRISGSAMFQFKVVLSQTCKVTPSQIWFLRKKSWHRRCYARDARRPPHARSRRRGSRYCAVMTIAGGPAKLKVELQQTKYAGIARRHRTAALHRVAPFNLGRLYDRKGCKPSRLQVRLRQWRLPSPIATELTQSSDLSRQGMMTTTVDI